MDSKRVFILLSAVVVLLFGIAGGGTYLGAKLLKNKGNDLLALKITNADLDSKETALVQAKKDIAKYTELEKIARTIVPEEKNEALTVLQIYNLADQAGISLASVTLPASALGQTTASGAAIAGGNPNTSQYTKVKNLNGVYSMDVTVQSDTKNLATYAQMLDFMNKLEHNRRTADITNISVQPSDVNRNLVQFTLVLTVYIKPEKL